VTLVSPAGDSHPQEGMSNLVIHSGALLDVVGRACWSSHFIFVPITADGYYSLAHPVPNLLSEHLNDQIPAWMDAFRGEWEVGYASWVRARLPAVFDFAPPGAPKSAPKNALMECAFASYPLSNSMHDSKAHLFSCTTYEDLEIGLAFFEPRPAIELEKLIASDFWDLLLREPTALSDFVEYVLLGADIDRSPCRVSWLHGIYSVEQIGEAIG